MNADCRNRRKVSFALYTVIGVFVAGPLVGCGFKFGRKSKSLTAQRVARARKLSSTTSDTAKKPVRPKNPALDKLGREVGARFSPIENPCAEGTRDNCHRQALDRFFVRLDTLIDAPQRNVRILHLGDSHVAADYITGTIRKRLQKRFGNAGRGFVHVEQRAQYGGRRLKRSGPWRRTRIVDKGQAGNPFGFAGMAIESRGANALVQYQLNDENRVSLFYHASPGGPRVSLKVAGQYIGSVDTKSEKPESSYKTFSIPKRRSKSGKDSRVLSIVAHGPKARLFGINYTKSKKGLLYDSIGPVGADARVYLSLQKASFSEHLQVLQPDLVVIMLGGNDGIRIRKGKATVKEVRREHEELIEFVQNALPDADCMLWSPMDAATRVGGKIVSKSHIDVIRDVQREAAFSKNCAFWDMYASMGEEDSILRWSKKNIINKDLIHPRRKAGELLGHLFTEALLQAYDQPE